MSARTFLHRSFKHLFHEDSHVPCRTWVCITQLLHRTSRLFHRKPSLAPIHLRVTTVAHALWAFATCGVQQAEKASGID